MVTDLKKKKTGEPLLLISGNWNSEIFLQKMLPDKGEPELVWRKTPYPE